MKNISLTIDDKKISCSDGKTLLWRHWRMAIYIPNLCAILGKTHPSASCRLCFVEVEGEKEPVVACTEPVKEGMVVHTRGKNALRLARTSAELILASHPVDCGHCQKNRSCELQKIANHLGIKLITKRFESSKETSPSMKAVPSLPTIRTNVSSAVNVCGSARRNSASEPLALPEGVLSESFPPSRTNLLEKQPAANAPNVLRSARRLPHI